MAPETWEETKTRYFKILDENKMFGADVDGYVKFWIDGGYLDPPMLRAIADELDRRNADWDKQINDYFAGVPDEPEPGDIQLGQLDGI